MGPLDYFHKLVKPELSAVNYRYTVNAAKLNHRMFPEYRTIYDSEAQQQQYNHLDHTPCAKKRADVVAKNHTYHISYNKPYIQTYCMVSRTLVRVLV